MSDRVLVDTGPLVAIESSRDAYHRICVDQLKHLRTPMISCWPVLTEAAWLLRTDPRAVQCLLRGFSEGLFFVPVLRNGVFEWLAGYMDRYRDMGVQLADARLVYLSEQEDIDTVFTLDFRNFGIYRRTDGRALQVVPLRTPAH